MIHPTTVPDAQHPEPEPLIPLHTGSKEQWLTVENSRLHQQITDLKLQLSNAKFKNGQLLSEIDHLVEGISEPLTDASAASKIKNQRLALVGANNSIRALKLENETLRQSLKEIR